MEEVIIGVDPHKLSATIEVVGRGVKLLGPGGFTTDQTGYAAIRKYAKAGPERVWAVEGANRPGPRRPSASAVGHSTMMARFERLFECTQEHQTWSS